MTLSTSSSSNNNFSLKNRIKYYNFINAYISKHVKNDPNNCISVYDNIIKIGSNIVLDKRIGSKSKWGLVFLSHYIINNLNNFIFATKIVDSSKSNNIVEYNILKLLTTLNITKEICPHFPICYGALKCDYNIINNSKLDLDKLQNQNLLFIFSELATNNLRFILRNNFNSKILLNAIAQILISIMFFNKYTNSFHIDGHSGNFLYHQIKPGGYFHYNINGFDYYIENLGYLWIIWDFGLIIPFSKTISNSSNDNINININYDFMKTLISIKKHNKNKNISNNINFIIKNIQKFDFEYDIQKMSNLINTVIKSLLKYTNDSFLLSLPHKAKIINKKPFKF